MLRSHQHARDRIQPVPGPVQPSAAGAGAEYEAWRFAPLAVTRPSAAGQHVPAMSRRGAGHGREKGRRAVTEAGLWLSHSRKRRNYEVAGQVTAPRIAEEITMTDQTGENTLGGPDRGPEDELGGPDPAGPEDELGGPH